MPGRQVRMFLQLPYAYLQMQLISKILTFYISLISFGCFKRSYGVGLLIRRLLVRFPTMQNDVVSLGKALHPTWLGDVPVLTVSHSG